MLECPTSEMPKRSAQPRHSLEWLRLLRVPNPETQPQRLLECPTSETPLSAQPQRLPGVPKSKSLRWGCSKSNNYTDLKAIVLGFCTSSSAYAFGFWVGRFAGSGKQGRGVRACYLVLISCRFRVEVPAMASYAQESPKTFMGFVVAQHGMRVQV